MALHDPSCQPHLLPSLPLAHTPPAMLAFCLPSKLIRPQDLCTGCSRCLELSSPNLHIAASFLHLEPQQQCHSSERFPQPQNHPVSSCLHLHGLLNHLNISCLCVLLSLCVCPVPPCDSQHSYQQGPSAWFPTVTAMLRHSYLMNVWMNGQHGPQFAYQCSGSVGVTQLWS